MKMNPKFFRKSVISFFTIGLLVLSGCNNLKTVIKFAPAVISFFTTVTVSMKQVEAATLDVEAKKLQIEGIKKNGEKVTVIQKLDSNQVQNIKDTGKTEIKLEDGSKSVVAVAIGDSKLEASSRLEKIKDSIENSPVYFKNKEVQVSGKISKSWIQKTSKLEDSGVGAKIEWNDGVISTILFLENSNTRIWVEGIEYSGQWSLNSSGILQVNTDKGSHYTFGS